MILIKVFKLKNRISENLFKINGFQVTFLRSSVGGCARVGDREGTKENWSSSEIVALVFIHHKTKFSSTQERGYKTHILG